MTPMGLPTSNMTPLWIQKVLNLRLRLIPLVLFCAFMLLSVKVYQVVHVFYPALEISALDATKSEKSASKVKPTPEKSDQKETTQPTDKKTDKKSDKTSVEASRFDPLALTSEKIRILKSLAKLRDDLNTQEKALQKKEELLQALQKKIDEKITQLTLIDSKLKETLKASQKEKEEEMKKIVAIYEKMKAADAAKILEGLELTVVTEIMLQMKDAKSSAILSKMSPEAARVLTAKLTERKKLNVETKKEKP